MKVLYILSALAVVGGIFLGMEANDAWDATERARMTNQQLNLELANLEAEVVAMQKLEPSPLRYADDALSEFFTRTVEAGEVLGAGVRIEPREMNMRAINFREFRQGVKVAQVTLRAGLETSGAAPILAMFEEELADLPVAVRSASARSMNDVVTLTMEVDVFGR